MDGFWLQLSSTQRFENMYLLSRLAYPQCFFLFLLPIFAQLHYWGAFVACSASILGYFLNIFSPAKVHPKKFNAIFFVKGSKSACCDMRSTCRSQKSTRRKNINKNCSWCSQFPSQCLTVAELDQFIQPQRTILCPIYW